ncbi:MAG: histidine kinase dimerization/phospho-acceptor domain-containing protein [Planctomycetota bacterium]|jgi:signal transduction histidine kinase|nr:histidine kinase dimerization/phospho-acceptor domain-containing protein [Planctomycetota bacterium]MDP6502436.1 histidine kinase dimerization/phospho-acceptor domain-containing protein [Planctomycetota bacterium]
MAEDKDAEIARLTSELEAAQKQLSNMKDMAKVGELAATMAHEIRNPLAGISSLSEVLRMKIDDSGPVGEIIDTILEEVDRLNRIIKDLLRFAKPGKAVLGSLNIPDTIGNVLTFLDERLTEGGFEVTREIADCPNVMADTEQMRQVFLNVLINAMDAIKDQSRRNPRRKSRLRLADRQRPGHPGRSHSGYFRAVLYHQGPGHRPGPGRLPQDHRAPRRHNRRRFDSGGRDDVCD